MQAISEPSTRGMAIFFPRYIPRYIDPVCIIYFLVVKENMSLIELLYSLFRGTSVNYSKISAKRIEFWKDSKNSRSQG